MARKQTSGKLSRFLDFIGLVDSEREDDLDQTPVKKTRGKTSKRADTDEFDEFDAFEEPAPVRRRMPVAAGRRNSRINLENNGDEFDEDQGWTSAAPSYARRERSRSAALPQRGASRSNYRSGEVPGVSASYERRSLAASSSGYRASEAQSRYRSAVGYAPSARRDLERDDLPSSAGKSAYQRHQTVIFTLRSVDECKDVILSLIDKKSALLNLHDLDAIQAQRALDTMSGATYAIGATLSPVSDRTYLITPSNVEVERSSMDTEGYN